MRELLIYEMVAEGFSPLWSGMVVYPAVRHNRAVQEHEIKERAVAKLSAMRQSTNAYEVPQTLLSILPFLTA
jgi:hypothetical protein